MLSFRKSLSRDDLNLARTLSVGCQPANLQATGQPVSMGGLGTFTERRAVQHSLLRRQPPAEAQILSHPPIHANQAICDSQASREGNRQRRNSTWR